MKINNTEDNITHMVLSNKEAIEFSVEEEDPVIYHMLYDSLYSDKPLAVCREVLCNAWDEHIKHGLEDVPVEVTLEKVTKGGIEFHKLSIKDRAKGIAPDKIKPLYGVMGGSDKRTNDKQTGGFGIGKMAPFALAEHFEITSCYEGTKSIYRATKSSGEASGKPGIYPIMDVPTTETGLTVTVDLPYNRNYETILKKLICLGAMNATLNGQKVKTIPLSQEDYDFIVTNTIIAQGINIRYGSVTYPLRDNEAYNKEFLKLVRILKMDSYYSRGNLSCVIQVPAGSVNITPSRESLSLTTKTIDTVKTALSIAYSTIDKARRTPKKVIVNRLFDEYVKGLITIEQLLEYESSILKNTVNKDNLLIQENIFNYITKSLTPYDLRLKLAKSGIINKDAVDNPVTQVLKILGKFMTKNAIPTSRIYIVKPYSNNEKFNSPKKSLNYYSPLKKTIILLSHAPITTDSIYSSNKNNVFLYHVKRSKKDILEARKIFENSPFTIEDQLDNTLLEKRVVIKKDKVPPKPKKISSTSWIDAKHLVKDGKFILSDLDGLPRTVTKPDLIIHVTRQENKSYIGEIYHPHDFTRFLDFYNGNVVITHYPSEIKKIQEKFPKVKSFGIGDISYETKQIVETSNPDAVNILKYMGYRNDSYIFNIPSLMRIFNLHNTITPELNKAMEYIRAINPDIKYKMVSRDYKPSKELTKLRSFLNYGYINFNSFDITKPDELRVLETLVRTLLNTLMKEKN